MDRIRIREIDQNDIETIRVWKNENRKSFFFQGEITPEMQEKWFSEYVARTNDFIFMAEYKQNTIWKSYGCLAYRERNNAIDLYNIIRGAETGGDITMNSALKMMILVIKSKYSCPIQCDVLVDNPAVSWYTKCGFVIDHEEDGYYVMKYDGE